MPVTDFQRDIILLLSKNRSPDSYLAGGAALNFAPQTYRFSNDLDYFQDSVQRVNEAFTIDAGTLEDAAYSVNVVIRTPSFVRAIIVKSGESTKVDWAHDSAWRFLPTKKDPQIGYVIDPIDLALNKLLALAGRDEPRDYLDVIAIHNSQLRPNLLDLGALIWAAVGKDPGFNPSSLLEILKRKGRYQPDDFDKLPLVERPNLTALKGQWLSALDSAEKLIERLPMDEVGCLYYSQEKKCFVSPLLFAGQVVLHFGRPGGLLPQVG